MGVWFTVFVVLPLFGGAILSPLVMLAHPLADNTNHHKSIFGVAAIVIFLITVIGFIFGVAWFNRAVDAGWEWTASGSVVALLCWFIGAFFAQSAWMRNR